MNRLLSIDVMRALAIVMMILCHYPIFLSSSEGRDAWMHFFSNHLIGDYAAPFFLFITGMSQVLSARKATSPEAAQSQSRRVVIRGCAIFLIALVFLFISMGPDQIITWDILTLIGMATLILLACRKLPLWAIVLICIAVYAATPFLRGWSDYLSFWGGALEMPPGISEVLPGIMLDPTGDYTPVWEFTKIISGLFVNGFFPIFPWIIFPLTGFMMGRSLVEDKLRASAPFILFIAFLFCVMGLGGASASQQIGHRSPMDHFISPLSFYPDSATMLLLQMGIVLLTFLLLWHVLDGRERSAPGTEALWMTYCRRLSRYSFTLYVAHLLLIFWPLWIVKWITGTFYYEEAMEAIPAFLLGLTILVAAYPVLGFWDKKGSRYSLEWALAQITEKSLKFLEEPRKNQYLPGAQNAPVEKAERE